MPDIPRYSEKEIQAILKDAAHRQHRSESVRQDKGLTLEEIEQIALEAGIDPLHVRSAVEALHEDAHESTAEKVWGGPHRLHFRRVIPGEIPPDELGETLVPIIRKHTKAKGQYETLGRTLTWNHGHYESSAPFFVKITSKDGKTIIEVVHHNLKGMAYTSQIGTLAFGLFTFLTIVSNGNYALIPFFLGLALVFFFVGRWAFDRYASNTHAKLARLTDTLEQAVRRKTGTQATLQKETPAVPQISLEELPESENQPLARGRTRTT